MWSLLYRADPKEGGGLFDKPNMLTMVVFMDGTVLKPVFKRNAETDAAPDAVEGVRELKN